MHANALWMAFKREIKSQDLLKLQYNLYKSVLYDKQCILNILHKLIKNKPNNLTTIILYIVEVFLWDFQDKHSKCENLKQLSLCNIYSCIHKTATDYFKTVSL